VKRFGARMQLPVRAPFRLDLTVDALRRLAANAVDVVGSDGTFYRAVRDERGSALLAIRGAGPRSVEVRATGRAARRWLPLVQRMLGTETDLRDWYARSARIDWLQPLAATLRGVKPPRYPSLWEACAHAVVFAQISIHAASAIMRRLVERLAEPIAAGGTRAWLFPEPERWLAAPEASLRAAGLSQNKIRNVRSIAAAFRDGILSERALSTLSTPAAAEALVRVRGIGPWSASVVLLRGLGRLDTFPLRDSGVARSVAMIAGKSVDLDAVLETLGPTRGMLYFHLLLGRLHHAALSEREKG
jgi:DNA-3-methyladenine glycosylase II